MNTARIISQYLEEHGDRYDLANSVSIRVLALDLQEALEHAKNPELWYFEGQPEQHCELVSWIGEDVTLRPLDGNPEFTVNGSFVGPVRNHK